MSAVKLAAPLAADDPTAYSPDVAWDALQGCLPAGIANRLKTVDRALLAMSTLHGMLRKDSIGKNTALTCENVTYEGFLSSDVEGMQLAILVLGQCAMRCLGEVRDNSHGCSGTKRERFA